MHRMARHHTKVHPNVPHEIYVDQYFNFDRPLFKCDFCKCKLLKKRLTKHLQRAHLFDNHPYTVTPSVVNKYTHAVPAASSIEEIIELSSDSEGEHSSTKKAKQLADKAVQCDVMDYVGRPTETQHNGVRQEVKESTLNTDKTKSKEVGTQTSKKTDKSLTEPRMQLSLEYVEEDGWMGLVFSLP